MSWLVPSITSTLLGSLVLAGVYLFLYWHHRDRSLGIWSLSWMAYSLRFLFSLLIATGKVHAFFAIGYQLSALLSGMLLIWGTYLFAEKKFPRWWFFFAVINMLWIVAGNVYGFRFLVLTVPTFLFLGFIYVSTGLILLKTKGIEETGRKIIAYTFILWGIHKADYPFLRQVEWFAPWGYLLGTIFELVAAFGILLIFFERARNDLADSREKYRRLLDTIPQGIQENDTSGIITYSNRAHHRILNYPEGELVGKAIWDMIPEEHKKAELQEYLKTLAETIPEPSPYSTKNLRKDGREVQVRVDWTYERDNMGLVTGFISVITDITQQVRMENEIREYAERLQAIYDNAMDGILLADLEERKFYSGNRMIQNMLGYSEEELKQLRVLDIHPPEDLPNVIEQFERQAEGEITLARNIPVKRKDGTVFYADINSSPITFGGKRYLIGIFRDTTETRKLEEQLRHSQKMEAVGQLAGGVAHDFNNILSAIVGYASLLHMKITDSVHKENIEEILNASEKAAKLTRSLLAFSRKQVMQIKSVNLNETIRDVLKLLSRIIGEHIELRTAFAEKSVIIQADAGQIEQVLMNLATNARDAMPDGGTLTVSTEIADIDPDFVRAQGFGSPGRYALLTITDSGIGMDEETKKKIFEPFYTTKEVGRGTGLGLAMTYGIIKQHEGFIICDSEPGKGTTFRIYLPLAQDRQEGEGVLHGEKGPEMPERGTETILLAEDDTALRKLAKTVLNEFGYRVIEARDGEEAVARYLENKDSIDLLILDGIMPKKNGKEVFDEISRMTQGMKAIFISGYTADILSRKELDRKGLEFLMKPVSPLDLLRKVRGVLDRKE